MLAHLTVIPRRFTHQKGFIPRVIENIKNEWSQSKEIKETVEKFRADSKKLEETEAIKQARAKFQQVEEQKEDINRVFEEARQSIKSKVDRAKETQIIQKTMKIQQSIRTRAKDAAEEITRKGDILKDTTAFKKMSEATKTVERELADADIMSSLYKAPQELVKRSDRSTHHATGFQQRDIKPDDSTQTVVPHKDSKFSESWKKFKDENLVFKRIFDMKMKYDESDNPFVRVTKSFVDRVGDIMGGLFQQTDLSSVLTEICKVDPNFDLNSFTNECEKFIIPTIMESLCQGRLDVLQDWCHEAVYNVLSRPHTEAEKLGLKIHTKILDIQNLDLAMGKIMDQGPVLVFTFHAQQISYVTDLKGNIKEGDPDKIVQNTYVMAFCRDQNDLDPATAWRLVDVAMQQSQFMF